VSRGAEDLKDNIKDAGSKLQSDSDSASKDLRNKADNTADDSEGMLKKVRGQWWSVFVCVWGGGHSECVRGGDSGVGQRRYYLGSSKSWALSCSKVDSAADVSDFRKGML
jgi:hypothetical protein